MKKSKSVNINELTAGDFPPVVRPFFTNSPDALAVLNVTVVLVSLMALGARLRVKYCFDMYRSMLVANLLVIGPSGAGKSLVRWIVQKIVAPLRQRDKEERRREQDYNDLRHKKGKNKDLPDEPLTVLRYMQSITVPKLVKRTDFMARRYGEVLPYMLYTDELMTMCKGSRANREEYNAVARGAYQEGESYLRDTLYQDGYNADVDINWCSIMCGQDYALEKYINKDGIMLGDAGRQILLRIEPMGDDAPTMKPFTDEEERLIETTSQRLMNETYTADDQLGPIHMIDMGWMEKDVRGWCKDQAKQITMNGSKAQESFYKRASSSAFRIASMMYYLWDENPKAQWHVRRCYYAYAQFILNGLMKQWGRQYEQLQPKPEDDEVAKPTLYDQLPKRFTRIQLAELIVRLELKTSACVFICKWLKKRLIFKVEGVDEVFEKNF